MRNMDADGVRALLGREIAKAGTAKAWAKAAKITDAYVCDVLRSRRDPGVSILDALGLEKIVTYRQKNGCP
jgi:hypothetical protein